MRSHWALRNVASLLSREGFPVLRFDYSGTGDSMGAVADSGPQRWCENVRTAAEELLDVSGASRLALVGFRLGATLAARAPLDGLRAETLLLWDPIVRGRTFISEMEHLQAQRVGPDLRRRDFAAGPLPELMGFDFPPAMRAAIERLELLEGPSWRPERTILMTSEDHHEFAGLLEAWKGRGLAIERRHLPDTAWSRDNLQAAMLSPAMLKAIAEALSGNAT